MEILKRKKAEATMKPRVSTKLTQDVIALQTTLARAEERNDRAQAARVQLRKQSVAELIRDPRRGGLGVRHAPARLRGVHRARLRAGADAATPGCSVAATRSTSSAGWGAHCATGR